MAKTKVKSRGLPKSLPKNQPKGLPAESSAQMTLSNAFLGLVFVGIVAVLMYILMVGQVSAFQTSRQTTPVVAENMKANMPSASETLSRSKAQIHADPANSTVKIQTPSDYAKSPSAMRNLIDDIKFATKGDGKVRDVKVNNKELDPALVKLAMFENQDFMPHDETKLSAKPLRYDPNFVPQRSHFRKMTYPLVYEGGKLGVDIIGNSKDVSVTIADKGGRNGL